MNLEQTVWVCSNWLATIQAALLIAAQTNLGDAGGKESGLGEKKQDVVTMNSESPLSHYSKWFSFSREALQV